MAASDHRLIRTLALVWLLLVLAITAHNAWLWTGDRLELETDVLAMLPQDDREPDVAEVTRALADAGARRIVVLVGADSAAASQRAGDAYAAALADSPVDVRYRIEDETASDWLDFFTPYRRGLLSAAQRQDLKSSAPAELANRAVQALYRPMAMPRIGSWASDPLNLFGAWLAARAKDSPIRVDNGRLSLVAGEHHYAVLMLESRVSAFASGDQSRLVESMQVARAAAIKATPDADVLSVGVPLYASAAAEQAQREVHTIGVGSFLGILLLTWFAFSAIRPRLLVMLSIAIGLATSISVCVLVFGKLHLITVVFGATLVGVAENYGSNWFSNRIGCPPEQRWTMLREQWPTMALAMATTVIGYALLALTPFPGLQQIALFSATGLIAAFLTVLLWFPFLDTRSMHFSRFAAWIGGLRARWPRVQGGRWSFAFSAVGAVVLMVGALRLQPNDDIRLLQNSPANLIADQRRLNDLLDLPSPAQFFIVSGLNAEAVLQREEALATRLDEAIANGDLRGYQAISNWVPSRQRQGENAALFGRVIDGERGVLVLASQQLGEAVETPTATTDTLLTISHWLAAPVSEPLRHQWLADYRGGVASVVLLRPPSGIAGAYATTKLAALSDTANGMRYVDKVSEISSLMQRYRVRMGWILAISYLLVFVALSLRFGRHAWRALLPTALASALTLALIGLLGEPLQLFNMLALLLILGMGVDYGIFLLAQPQRDLVRPFLTITLAAISTLLAFGLLALSGTPALHAFGLTMLFGIGLAWLLTPMFMPRENDEVPSQPGF
ncbi:MAG: hypothetical protein WBP11_14005 [Dokdonella sp.]